MVTFYENNIPTIHMLLLYISLILVLHDNFSFIVYFCTSCANEQIVLYPSTFISLLRSWFYNMYVSEKQTSIGFCALINHFSCVLFVGNPSVFAYNILTFSICYSLLVDSLYCILPYILLITVLYAVQFLSKPIWL